MTATRKLFVAALATLTLTAGAASAQPAARAQAQQSQPQPVSASAEKPDLIVTDIVFDAGDNEVKVKVKNVGDKRADDSRVRLKITVVGGNAAGSVLFDEEKRVGGIGSGNDKTEDFDVDFDQIKTRFEQIKTQLLANIDRLNVGTAVKARLKQQLLANLKVQAVATADSRNEIAEKNEGNNNRTEAFPTN